MRWGVLFAFLFGLFILEGSLFQVFSFHAGDGDLVILPRFVLVVLIFISLYIGRRKASLIGLLFGLFYDVLYCDVIGVYAFSLSIIPYLSALAYQYFQLNVILIILTVFLSVFAHDTLVFFLYELFGLTGNAYDWLGHLPTALFNACVGILLYKPLDKLFGHMDNGRQEDDGSA